MRHHNAEFLIETPDRCMVDRSRQAAFSRIGQCRSIFAGSEQWIWLHDALAHISQQTLAELGSDRWASLGGRYRGNVPFCDLRSPMAKQAVQNIAGAAGGLLWHDENSKTDWAIRLYVEDARRTSGIATDIRVMRQPEKASPFESPSLRLGSRAEQYLWLLHAQVLQQRRSVICVPDVMFGQLTWAHSHWPKTWRREIKETLLALTRLRITWLLLAGEGWNPQLGATSVAVAGFEDRAITSKKSSPDECTSRCPLFGRGPRHRHFIIQMGLGFLGALQNYAIPNASGLDKEYEFSKPTDADAAKELRLLQDRGETPSVFLPLKLLGSAQWSGLTTESRSVLDGVLGELTRAPASQRSDMGRTFEGRTVVGARRSDAIYCPLLELGRQYVAFAGNGRRPGMGYLLLGRKNTGWLHKCGYRIPIGTTGLMTPLRDFLKQIEMLQHVFELTIAALDPHSLEWYDLEHLRAVSARSQGWETLEDLHVRFYAPTDYQDQLRRYLAEKGGFLRILGGAVAGYTSGFHPLDLQTRVQLSGLHQHELAAACSVSQPYISRLLNGRKPWPEGHRRTVEALLATRTSSR